MIKKIFLSFQANILTAVLNLVITILTAKYLGAAGRGELTIIITYIAFIQIVNEISGTSSIFHILNRFTVSEIVSVSSIWFLLISFSGTFLLVLSNAITTYLSVIVFLSIFLFAIHNLLIRIILNKINLNWYNLITILQPFIIVVLILLSGYKNLSVKSFLLFQLYSYLALIIVSMSLLKNHFLKIRNVKIKPLVLESFKLGFINQTSNLAQNLNYRVAYLFLQKYWGISSVGVFSLALSVVNVIWLFSSTLATLLSNEVAKSSNSTDQIKLTIKGMNLTFVMTVLIVIIVLLVPTDFYIYLLNKDFIDLKRLILIMSPAIVIFSITKIVSHYFSGIGKLKYNFYASALGLVSTFSTAPFIIKNYNIDGAAISNSISYIFSAFILLYFFKKRSRFLSSQ